MFVRAQSKQRFGDVKQPFVNIENIATAELSHAEGLGFNIKMSNGDEFTVVEEQAKLLLAFLEQNSLK